MYGVESSQENLATELGISLSDFFLIYFFPIAWKSQLQRGFRRNPTTTPHGSVSQDLFLCLWSKSSISSCRLRSSWEVFAQRVESHLLDVQETRGDEAGLQQQPLFQSTSWHVILLFCQSLFHTAYGPYHSRCAREIQTRGTLSVHRELAPVLPSELFALLSTGFDLCPGMVKLWFAVIISTNNR